MENYKMKVILNHHGDSDIFQQLERIGLIKKDYKYSHSSSYTIRGIRGLSFKPRWDGMWDGIHWTNSSICLTEKGLEILKNSNIKGWEIK